MVGALQFLVAGGDGAVLLEAVDEALDPIALTIGDAVEAHPALRLGGAPGNDRSDATPPQIGAHRSAGIAFVPDDSRWPHAGPPRARATAPRSSRAGACGASW